MNTTSKSTNSNQVTNTFTTTVQVTETSRLAQHSKLLTSEYILGTGADLGFIRGANINIRHTLLSCSL